MANSPLWITEADVVSLIDLGEAVDALERVLALEAADQARNMPKTHLMVGENDALHALGAAVAGEGIAGTKTWLNVGGKSQTMLVLFSLQDGSLKAMIEATALGQMRTGAMTGVGTRWLAADDADDMAVVGTGKQALTQIAACHAVRPLKRLRVFSRNQERRRAFAATVLAAFDFEVTVGGSLEDTVKDAPIVTLVTNATEPFFFSGMAAPGAHINAVGAIVPKRVEFGQDIFPRCAAVAVDTLAGVKDLSAEFREYYGGGTANWDQVQPISGLVKDGKGRPAGADLTLFKSMGMGLSDLALGIEILKRASAQGIGHKLPDRKRTPPRLMAAE